jgi:hypothetical protein
MKCETMSNVVELQAVRRNRDRELFEAHRSALTELICSYTCHMNHPDLPSLERFLDAQEAFIDAWLTLNEGDHP